MLRIGIDFGGTKIEACALAEDGRQLWRERVDTPRGDYSASVLTVVNLVDRIEVQFGKGEVGVGFPGVTVADTGLVKNANSAWLNGKPFHHDLEVAIGRPIRCANDANCFAVSEAADGSGEGYSVVFGVILGTGCGAGVVIDGKARSGPNGIAGEWAHNPLPWPSLSEYPGQQCYCGRRNCIESWLSGPSFEGCYHQATGSTLRAEDIVHRAIVGELEASACLARYEDRLARALAHVVNVLDPDVIVLGGGMSKVKRFYDTLPLLVGTYVFGRGGRTPIVAATHGDSSGVRGAAFLSAV